MTFTATTIRTGCKVNFYLHITDTREDGFHELDTVFLPLAEPFDELTFAPGAKNSGCTISCNREELCGSNNIINKAWKRFADRTNFSPDIAVHLEKHIPDGAGLGGGSANAAGMLSFLNEHAGPQGLSQDELISLAADIGADVPFFLLNTPCHARGIGEKLEEISLNLKNFTLLLICPPIKISTPWAFQVYDSVNANKEFKKSSNSCLTSKRALDIKPSSRDWWLFNSFEEVVFPAFPELRSYKRTLIEHGAAGAVMSGSGASLFALYREMEMAQNAAAELAEAGVATYFCRL